MNDEIGLSSNSSAELFMQLTEPILQKAREVGALKLQQYTENSKLINFDFYTIWYQKSDRWVTLFMRRRKFVHWFKTNSENLCHILTFYVDLWTRKPHPQIKKAIQNILFQQHANDVLEVLNLSQN
jgi:hypothetical protein